MNKDNQCFILVKDWAPLIFRMTEEEKAAILTGLFKEAVGEHDYSIPSSARGVFDFFMAQIEKNDEKWTETRQRRREAGKKGGEAKANNADQSQANPSNAKQSQANPSNAKHNENENENENENGFPKGNKEREKERDSGKPNPSTPKPKPEKNQIPPKIERVRAYFVSIGSTENEADKFFDYWEARGWKNKSGLMRDWQASARTWVRNTDKFEGTNTLPTPTQQIEPFDVWYQRRLREEEEKKNGNINVPQAVGYIPTGIPEAGQ